VFLRKSISYVIMGRMSKERDRAPRRRLLPAVSGLLVVSLAAGACADTQPKAHARAAHRALAPSTTTEASTTTTTLPAPTTTLPLEVLPPVVDTYLKPGDKITDIPVLRPLQQPSQSFLLRPAQGQHLEDLCVIEDPYWSKIIKSQFNDNSDDSAGTLIRSFDGVTWVGEVTYDPQTSEVKNVFPAAPAPKGTQKLYFFSPNGAPNGYTVEINAANDGSGQVIVGFAPGSQIEPLPFPAVA
jgi:hypothetical protein